MGHLCGLRLPWIQGSDAIPEPLLERLLSILGPEGLLTGASIRGRAVGWADRSPCQALVIARVANTEAVSRVLAACHEAGQPVVAMGEPTDIVQGPVSTEHGIGIEKRPWLALTCSENEIAPIRMLKQALDPRGILNRGRVVG